MRAVTYSHDSFGLGHLRRTFGISRQIAENFPASNVLSLIGLPMAHIYFDPESRNHDFVKLPAIQKTPEGNYEPRHLSMPICESTTLRGEIIGATLRSFKPNLILIDKTPRGIGDELVVALEEHRRRYPEDRIILSLRDVLDEPDVVHRQWKDKELVSWIADIYSDIWIWGEQSIFDTVQEYRFPPVLAEKTKYMGYLPPAPAQADYVRLRAKGGITGENQRLLLVTTGGGGDGIGFLRNVLPGIEAAADEHLRVLLVAGPLMSEAEFEEVRQLTRPLKDKVRLVRFLSNFEDWIRASDGIICMGGYNTMREIAALGKATLVVPRTHPRREQEIRASIFSHFGWCHIVQPHQHIPHATKLFCQRLSNDRLVHSVTTLACRGYDNLLGEVERMFPAETRNNESYAIG